MWTNELTNVGALAERDFTLNVDARSVPGVVWQPDDVTAGAPLVLLGHGGTTHKRAEYVVAVAQMLGERGVVSMAIDGPGHGDRNPRGSALDNATFAEAWEAGGGTDAIVADWRAALDFVSGTLGTGPVGYWGLSMGTMMGLPLIAAEPRITVALLGLMGGWGPNGKRLLADAPKITIPLRFLVQWDDELIPREKCLDLFGALGARRKTLHANPGTHAAVPQFEIRDSADYLARNLARQQAR
jgi:pimeloyl-ACP methyl ester carboxylesterase